MPKYRNGTAAALAIVLIFSRAAWGQGEKGPENHFSVDVGWSLDSGDYGGDGTITTTSGTITFGYSFASRWTLELSVTPYLYLNETYTDVVLVNGKSVHHANPAGIKIHSYRSGETPLSSGSSAALADQRTTDHIVDHDVDHHNEMDRKLRTKHAVTKQVTPPAGKTTADGKALALQSPPMQEEIQTAQVIDQHESASGIGDTNLNVAYRFLDETDQVPEMSLLLGIKIPTADEDKGLGTGEYDYLIGLDLSKGLGDWVLGGGISYNVLGDPAEYDLNNYLSGYIALSTGIFAPVDFALEMDVAEAASDESDPELSLGCTLGYDFRTFGYLSGGVSLGLADGSPDYSLFVSYGITF